MMDGAELRILEHDLVSIDGTGARCACGTAFALGDVALMLLEVGPTPDERREQKYRDEYQRRLVRQRAIAESDLARAQRVLAERQAEHERRWEALEATGLTTFLDRSDWLRAHRTADEIRADRLRWEARVEEASHLAGITYLRPRAQQVTKQVTTERRTA